MERKYRLLLLVVFLLQAPMHAQDTIPTVDFVVVRMDFQTRHIKGYYTFSQPFRKTLQPKGYTQVGDNYLFTAPAADFGYTRIVSRLTGQQIYRASTVWAGCGSHEFPNDSFDTSTNRQTFTKDPKRLDRWVDYGPVDAADSAWREVRDLDAIVNLSHKGDYTVLVYDHLFCVGVIDPSTAEWVVIAATSPPAPRDVAIISIDWPQQFASRNLPIATEITVHNFGPATENFAVDLSATGSTTTWHLGKELVLGLAPDSSLHITFQPWTADSAHSLVWHAQIVTVTGTSWSDAYSDNDSASHHVTLIDYPMFRISSSPGKNGFYPLRAFPGDYDRDGDIDFLTYDYFPRFLRNDSNEVLTDITDLFPVQFHPYPRLALFRDLTGDSIVDLLVVNFGLPIQLLAGDGHGGFIDASESSGVASVTGTWWVTAFDMDNDGDDDLLFPQYDGVVLLKNDGHGHFTNVTAGSGIGTTAQVEASTADDVDNDGDLDLFLVCWDSHEIGIHHLLYLNNGFGNFTEQDGPWRDDHFGRAARIFDYNHDGLPDIYVSNSFSSDKLYKNTGSDTFIDVTNQAGITGSSFFADAADFDGDGYLDVIVDKLDSLKLYVNNGDSTFANASYLLSGQEQTFGFLGSSGLPEFVDLDHDGDLDIYSQASVFLNAKVVGQVKEAVPSAVSSQIAEGWNMISIPVSVEDGRRETLFPQCTSSAFSYSTDQGYTPVDTLAPGTGYWLKFPSSEAISVNGEWRFVDSLPVSAGWNMIGSLSLPTDVSTITSLPAGIVESHFFGFRGGYRIADSLLPLQAYWVKVNQAGQLIVNCVAGTAASPRQSYSHDKLADLNQLTVTDARGFEQTLYFGPSNSGDHKGVPLPPSPPEGILDVSFGDHHVIETFPDPNEPVEYPITISSARYPVVVSWSVISKSEVRYILVKDAGRESSAAVTIAGNGKLTLANSPTGRLHLRVEQRAGIPENFLLHQNYPNPFNPVTTIEYEIPRPDFVTLKVFNVLGQEVKTIVQSHHAAGRYHVTFRAEDLPSGMYFYRLNSTGAVMVRKALLLR